MARFLARTAGSVESLCTSQSISYGIANAICVRPRNLSRIACLRRILPVVHAVSALNQSRQLLRRTSMFFAGHGLRPMNAIVSIRNPYSEN
jgi:hypothetical protein